MGRASFRYLVLCALQVMVVFTSGMNGNAQQLHEMVREVVEPHLTRCRLIFFNFPSTFLTSSVIGYANLVSIK